MLVLYLPAMTNKPCLGEFVSCREYTAVLAQSRSSLVGDVVEPKLPEDHVGLHPVKI